MQDLQTNNKKKKKNYDAIGTVPKSNRQTVETETKSMHIYISADILSLVQAL